jgi:2-C-methyl-D-erythritol 4-phosphate cytidylyltransferase
LRTAAVIVAGGSGSRMQSVTLKQFIDLAGKPLLAHTLSRFERCESVDEIILVLPALGFREHADLMARWVSGIKSVDMVPGGDERQDSMTAGLERLPSSYEGLVAIHDGARPLVSEAIIREVVETAKHHGCALAALPVYETLKEVSGDRVVIRTADRGRFYKAQTPQCFRYAILRAAIDKARLDGFRGTDEAAIVERLNVEVHIVPGSETNIKVTTASDLALAAYYLTQETQKHIGTSRR